MGRKTITSLDALAVAGFYPEGITPALRKACASLPLSVPSALLDLIDKNDPEDPIRVQFLPQESETHEASCDLLDPIGDEKHTPVKGVIHRYPDRVLLNLVSSCAAYCRFCFRRAKVGRGAEMLTPTEIEAALQAIAARKGIREVILSGGDPLTLSDARLADIVARLSAIPHLRLLRIHTRMPIVDPARITESLLKACKSRLPVYLLLHCNHPRELTKAARAALDKIADNGIVMLSQSVLLQGVNDQIEILEALMRAFLECRVIPHYIHHPDLAAGTEHFRPSLERGIALMQDLRQRLSGLGQPTYILEIPGGVGKIPVAPAYATKNDDGSWRIMSPDGSLHVYPPLH